ncbi:hypothetical protein ABW19_dt0210251 [Dactylella cylindrospora]|nr:hypothetical protein ABW19_dt0210251 [Dactylella cylindrospora]
MVAERNINNGRDPLSFLPYPHNLCPTFVQSRPSKHPHPSSVIGQTIKYLHLPSLRSQSPAFILHSSWLTTITGVMPQALAISPDIMVGGHLLCPHVPRSLI